jgi:peroxiredoxin
MISPLKNTRVCAGQGRRMKSQMSSIDVVVVVVIVDREEVDWCPFLCARAHFEYY